MVAPRSGTRAVVMVLLFAAGPERRASALFLLTPAQLRPQRALTAAMRASPAAVAARCGVVTSSGGVRRLRPLSMSMQAPEIESPFADPSTAAAADDDDAPLALTLDNVERVLDEMRPYLMSDGGNVRVVEIDGPVVRLELQGACGSCPSSTMTMKMGLERRLVEKIPEIQEVVQSIPAGPTLAVEEIEKVLDTVRPFLSVAGGKISVASLEGVGGLQPRITLKMEGQSAALQSVKMEIMQRLQRNFMTPGLRVDWA